MRAGDGGQTLTDLLTKVQTMPGLEAIPGDILGGDGDGDSAPAAVAAPAAETATAVATALVAAPAPAARADAARRRFAVSAYSASRAVYFSRHAAASSRSSSSASCGPVPAGTPQSLRATRSR